jgi:hypothetical protein
MSSISRRPVHTRQYRVDVYARDDGLWDLDAEIIDTKHREIRLERGPLPAGEALHHMTLTVTIQPDGQIVAAQAKTQASPYPDVCASFPEAYQALVGLNLIRGFRQAVRERLGGTQACTHLTEMTNLLPTAAFQAIGGEAMSPKAKSQDTMPMPIDRCRALRRDGPVVARLYPRWRLVPDQVEGETR